MMWEDKALLLSLSKKSKTLLVLNLLTEHHGRVQCKMTLEAGNTPMLLPGSKMSVAYSPGDLGRMGAVKIDDLDAGILAESAQDIAITIVSYVNKMLTDLLEPEEPADKIYHATLELFVSLAVSDKRWPIHFARWEMALIGDLGFAHGFDRCRSAYVHGDQIYFSPEKGAAYPREEVGAFLDKMIPVPALLMGARNASVVDVRQAMELTALMYEKFVCPELGLEPLGERREQIKQAFRRFRSLPAAREDVTPGEMSEEDRARRMESLKPLMIQMRSASG